MCGGQLMRFGSALLTACRPDVASSLACGASLVSARPILLRGSAWARPFSTESAEKKGDANATADQAAKEEKPPSGPSASGDGAAADTSSDEAEPTVAELMAQLKSKEEAAGKLTQQVETLTDSLKRTLADMENLRARTAREVDVSKKFAIQGFVKAILDVPDNLERAAGVVPPEALKEDGTLPPEKLRSLLTGLVEGVRATENILMKVLKQHGVERYDAAGQPFDPNLHNALFDVPDPSKENNTIAIVTKVAVDSTN
ncbi:hypothetical protein HYH03_003776 [Edaphochlamys debaryana]|uniref:GrpE protein homolog n=1 Tax=Edaphochlamys debaryana TaxID=47281 RepID=A0A835Y9K2_9CHLO|nr:hypothetical protein HYH03_003776 [Edaphochlamys debaryana]|eukprot:KAG2498526.1 hypothetical protein HYH03_003776 [Edaphochlamys debaryana]